MNKNYNIETEYKFVVDKLPKYYDRKLEIIQQYFNKDNKKDLIIKLFNLNESEFDALNTTRVRLIKEDELIKRVITLKTKGNVSRKEYELEISEGVYNDLIKDNVLSVIKKVRYIVNKEFNFEFDEYLNLNSRLITCEVEVDDETTNNQFGIFLKDKINKEFNINAIDVTNDYRYKNSNLHKYF